MRKPSLQEINLVQKEASVAYLSRAELEAMSFASLGTNVLISTKASVYNPELITIGDYSRIDDFCCISGKITIGRNVHFAALSNIAGGEEGITFGDFSGLAYGCQVFSQSDDYTGMSLTNPTVPEKYKNVLKSSVTISKHVIIGTNSVVFPGVTIAEGCAIAALSLVNKNTEAWGIYAGVPARRIKNRSQEMLKLESEWGRQNANTK